MVQIEINETLYQELMSLKLQDTDTVESVISSLVDDSTGRKSLEAQLDILSLAADAVVAVNSGRRIVSFNSGAEALFNYDADDIIGENINTLLPDDIRTRHGNNIQDFFGSSVDSRYMAERQALQARKKNGDLFWADISLLKYRVVGQDYVIAIVRDVTQVHDLIAELQETEQTLRLMTDNATDLICLHAPDGTYEFVSQSSQSIVGYSHQDLIGKNPYDYFHPDDIENITASHEASNSGVSQRLIYRFRTCHDEYIWFETITRPIFDDNGQVINLVTVSRDVTETKQAQIALQYERDFVSSILELSPAAVTVVTAEGQITLTNKRAEQVLGIKKKSITSRMYDAPDWQHTDYDGNPWPDEKQPFVRVMNTKKPVWDVRHAIDKPTGERIYLAINGMPMLDDTGEVQQIIFTVEDYTERKLQQDQLEAALEQEKRLNEMKSKFLSIISHEFKTPLSIIMTSTSLLRLQADKMTPDMLQKRLNKIERQVNHLTRMIDDVTVINKEAMVGYRLRPIELHMMPFFDGIVDDFKLAFPDVTVTVKNSSAEDTCYLDLQMAHHIFDNLISNAMKYSGDGGEVTILYSVDKTESMITVMVKDTGIGIPEEDQRELFEVFHRGTNVGNINGTGLGLNIVKSCVDALNGSITFESVENQGTIFIVSLPIQ